MSLIQIFLPDGSSRSLPSTSNVLDVAKSISPGLAKSSIAGKVNGNLVDLDYSLRDGDKIEILTDRSVEGLDIIRHSTVHVMAMAIQDLFPGTQITIGPVVENQFYYDIYPKEGVKIGTNDFPQIEKKMQEIIAANIPFVKRVVSKEEAIQHFEKLGEKFKVEIVKELPTEGDIKIYAISHWDDLCRGPHVSSTGKLGAFKLMSVAGAYWRGDESRKQLTRIYGVTFPKQSELSDYLKLLEEAKKRDHRKLGKELELFTFSEKVGMGLPLWLPKGAALREKLVNFLQRAQVKSGYEQVVTPHIGHKNLYITSGHYEKYGADSFQPIRTPDVSEEFLLLNQDLELSLGQLEAFNKLVERRERLEPIAYIVGCKEFYGRDL